MNTRPTLTKEDLQKIRKVQLKMDHVATNLLAGMYRSHFKGRGIEFEEVREFQAGDELRSVDWNVTARMGTPYIKLFKEERELTILLALDISASTRFGSKKVLKSTILAEIGAALAFSGIKNQDKIGLILFSDHVEHYLPPAKGIRHVLRLIRDLMAFSPKGRGTNLESFLRFLGKVQKKRAVVFLLSDFLTDQNLSHQTKLIAKMHDLIAIAVQDPLETHLPKMGLLPITDLESGRTDLVDTSSPELNAHIKTQVLALESKAEKMIKGAGGSWIKVTTDVPYVAALRKFFLKRRHYLILFFPFFLFSEDFSATAHVSSQRTELNEPLTLEIDLHHPTESNFSLSNLHVMNPTPSGLYPFYIKNKTEKSVPWGTKLIYTLEPQISGSHELDLGKITFENHEVPLPKISIEVLKGKKEDIKFPPAPLMPLVPGDPLDLDPALRQKLYDRDFSHENKEIFKSYTIPWVALIAVVLIALGAPFFLYAWLVKMRKEQKKERPSSYTILEKIKALQQSALTPKELAFAVAKLFKMGFENGPTMTYQELSQQLEKDNIYTEAELTAFRQQFSLLEALQYQAEIPTKDRVEVALEKAKEFYSRKDH